MSALSEVPIWLVFRSGEDMYALSRTKGVCKLVPTGEELPDNAEFVGGIIEAHDQN